jgi:imidazoleglycerol-phosphate dehydratase
VSNESRGAELARKTGETDVSLKLSLDGDGAGTRETGVGFLDHMLDLFARHGHFDLEVAASGDLKTGAHHTVEDVGIVLGQAFDNALGDRAGITRYATATIPMDEARATTSIDISGRPFVAFSGGNLGPGLIGDFDAELTEEFLRAFANNANLTLHVVVEAGSNAHHIVEAVFKSLARALRSAVAIDPDQHGVPSTKGTLTD